MPLQKILLHPVPVRVLHPSWNHPLYYNAMQNSLYSILLQCTYMFWPISRHGQTLPSYSFAHTSSLHMTYLPYVHQSFRYLQNIPYHHRIQNKNVLLLHKNRYGMHPLFFVQLPPVNNHIPQIHFDIYLCKMHLSSFVSFSLYMSILSKNVYNFIYIFPAQFICFGLYHNPNQGLRSTFSQK